jgi:hypothetical protein
MTDKKARQEAIKAKADIVAEECDADILLCNGGMDNGIDHVLIRRVLGRKHRRPNLILALATEGGDANAAFRIARCLQSSYQRFTVVVPGWCKSAGTLICVGAHELLIGDLGELGPLDVQLTKPDELGLRSSGLTIDSSFRSLQTVAFGMFETFMLDFIKRSGGVITTKTAAELSATLTTGLLSPIFGQMDPMKIGEDFRSTRIAEEYAVRLDAHTHNVTQDDDIDGIESLVRGYPSHGFVIDRTEAEELFENVGSIEGNLKELIDLLGSDAAVPRSLSRSETPAVLYLNNEAKENVSAETEGATDGSRDVAGHGAQQSAEAGSGGEVPSDTSESNRDVAIPKLRTAKGRG